MSLCSSETPSRRGPGRRVYLATESSLLVSNDPGRLDAHLTRDNTDVYARKLDVLNRGLSGYNTDWATPVFKRTIATRQEQEHVPKIRLLIIWFGANDSCIRPSPQHVPLSKFAKNLKDWVDLVHSPKSEYYSPDTRIILITPPPVNTYQRSADLASRNPPCLLDREFETTRKYADAVKDVGREKGVAVTDVWAALWEAAGKDEPSLSKFMYDGLHLNAEGYEVLYEALITTIRESYPEVAQKEGAILSD
ncbi:hypothetical protein C0991_008315 [Blastosporella zonata]|nr:hypothetical protein C0991_008315 [Blastosporella zonata]